MSARELITEHLDLWTGAVTHKSKAGRGSNGKIELTGIKKLRELILEFAVRGKLVEQDPSDEPASVLLERIAEEKARLVKEGKIRNSRTPPTSAIDNAMKKMLPINWEEVPLGSIVFSRSGNSKLIKGKLYDTPSESLFPGYSASGQDIWLKNYEYEGDAVILSAVGARCGKTFLAKGKWSAIANTHILWPAKKIITPSYAQLILNNEDFWERSGGAQPFVKVKKTLEKTIWLPPINEQSLIVRKVSDLMSLCDRLEQQVGDQLEAHDVLVDTLLDSLTRSADASEVAENWARIAEHFDTLFTTEASIDKLKQTILQLAVMGRLVEQDPEDEPGGALVSTMLQLRDHLATTDGMRTKASDSLPSNEQYLSIPSSWAWVRLGNMAKFIDYRGKTPTKTSNGKRLITAKNIRQGYIDLEPEEFISEGDYTNWMTRGFPRKGDLVFTPEAPLGNAAIIDLDEEFALAQRAICFQWHVPDTSRFMLIHIMASPFQAKLVENATGMTATGIKASKLKEIPVAIPPLAEQHRIVEKVDELMALCDQLKARLGEAGETRTQLAEAVVEQAVQ